MSDGGPAFDPALYAQQFRLIERLAKADSVSIPGKGRVKKWEVVAEEAKLAAEKLEAMLTERGE